MECAMSEVSTSQKSLLGHDIAVSQERARHYRIAIRDQNGGSSGSSLGRSQIIIIKTKYSSWCIEWSHYIFESGLPVLTVAVVLPVAAAWATFPISASERLTILFFFSPIRPILSNTSIMLSSPKWSLCCHVLANGSQGYNRDYKPRIPDSGHKQL